MGVRVPSAAQKNYFDIFKIVLFFVLFHATHFHPPASIQTELKTQYDAAMKKILFISILISTLFTLSNCDYTGASDDDFYLGSLTGESSSNNENSTEPQAGLITAGEWNDLENWLFIDSLLNADTTNIQQYWSFYINNRISVKVSDNTGKAAIDIPVYLKRNGTLIWTARTDNYGQAELWVDLFQPNTTPDLSTLTLEVQNISQNNVKKYLSGINEIQLNETAQISGNADIAFVVDATGSMGDELEFLKTELLDVINTAKNNNPDITLKMGSVFYRDEGDEYLTRVSNFNTDIQTTIDFIKKQNASGGGDFPEAVHTALSKAINTLEWSASARTRLLFLVLDAPPHFNSQVISSLQTLIGDAASKGIKIIPVTASGIDKSTEFIMRFFDIATNGTYVFITNDSGIGNEHLQPTIGHYEVEHLNSLMVRLINKYTLVN